MGNKAIDLERIVEKLDITPSMYLNAVDKYRAVSTYLNSNGILANFYPQGSFQLGTVVRPYINSRDADYDLDVICELQEAKEITEPYKVKQVVGIQLQKNEVYKSILAEECDRCWTLHYAKVNNDIGFDLDIVPAVHQDEATIANLIFLGVPADRAASAIAITDKLGTTNYRWYHSNPKGYGLWFKSINDRFITISQGEFKKKLYEANKGLFASVEAIPAELDRTSLQRVIQILKRHRDIYYTNINKRNLRPTSAIVTTLAAKISSHAYTYSSLYDLLVFVVEDLNKYSQIFESKPLGYYINNETRSYIQKSATKWRIENPVDPKDNYADSWTDETALAFFQWVRAVKRDIIDSVDSNEFEYYISMKTGLGSDLVENAIPESKKQPIPNIQVGTKPWGC